MGNREIVDKEDAGRACAPKSVLIVEDNFIIALDAEHMLRELGVEDVWTAGSKAEALAILARELPQFVLLDVNLGEEKSFEVSERLRELGVPFAFGTGYGDPLTFPKEFADAPVVSKPYQLESLARVLSSVRG